MLFRLVYDTRVVVIAIKAAEGKVSVDFVRRLCFFRIVPNGSDDLMDLFFSDLFRIVDDFKIFGLGIPGGEFYPAAVESPLDPFLTHNAVPENLDVSLNILVLCERWKRRHQAENKQKYDLILRFHIK